MNMLLVWLVGVLVTCAHPAVPRRISPPQRAPNIRDYIMINRQLYYYVQHRQNVKQPPNIVQKSSFMLETLDAMQSLMTGGSHYNRTYFTKLRRCMDTMGPQLARSQDAAWKGILTYWNNNGSLADPWGGTNLVYMEKNSSRTMQDNMIIYEPCNYASNVAFYHVVTEFCDRVSYGDPFSIPKKYVKALGKAFSQVAMGSSFMHGSHTNLGAQQDTRAMNVMAYVIHQASILPLRSNSPILRDLSLRRRPYTSLELADEFEKMFIAMPVETWYNRTAHLSPPDYNLSLSGIVATLFSVGLSKATVDNILPSVMDLFGINRDIKTFILQRYLPTLRRSLRHVELGYIEGTVYLGNVINLVMKFFYAFFMAGRRYDR